MSIEPFVGKDVVNFRVPVRGRSIKALISRQALEDHFGAGPTSQDMLNAYCAHAEAINGKIQQLVLDGVPEPVLVKAKHF